MSSKSSGGGGDVKRGVYSGPVRAGGGLAGASASAAVPVPLPSDVRSTRPVGLRAPAYVMANGQMTLNLPTDQDVRDWSERSASDVLADYKKISGNENKSLSDLMADVSAVQTAFQNERKRLAAQKSEYASKLAEYKKMETATANAIKAFDQKLDQAEADAKRIASELQDKRKEHEEFTLAFRDASDSLRKQREELAAIQNSIRDSTSLALTTRPVPSPNQPKPLTLICLVLLSVQPSVI